MGLCKLALQNRNGLVFGELGDAWLFACGAKQEYVKGHGTTAPNFASKCYLLAGWKKPALLAMMQEG